MVELIDEKTMSRLENFRLKADEEEESKSNHPPNNTGERKIFSKFHRLPGLAWGGDAVGGPRAKFPNSSLAKPKLRLLSHPAFRAKSRLKEESSGLVSQLTCLSLDSASRAPKVDSPEYHSLYQLTSQLLASGQAKAHPRRRPHRLHVASRRPQLHTICEEGAQRPLPPHNIPQGGAEEAEGVGGCGFGGGCGGESELSADELASYLHHFLFIPKKMSSMAEMMYT